MQTGSAYGAPDERRGEPLFGIGTFLDDEGGYTTVAMAVALLVSLTLVFSAASAGWVASRSADVQTVADATAMAGADAVAAFWTIASVLDACVLSLGLVGVLVLGAGVVISAIPGIGEAGVKVIDVGREVLDARRDFAKSAAEGLEKLEATLPLLIVSNSSATVMANGTQTCDFVGCAIPFPSESQSDFSSLGDDVGEDEIADESEELREATEMARDAKERADAALEEGWRADCGDSPHNLCERSSALAALSEGDNPFYPSSEGWSFGVPLERARAYYGRRLAVENPLGSGIDALTDSCAREAFYSFALSKVNSGSYFQADDGSVSIDLPELPKNTDEVRNTRLYTDVAWPCTAEDQGVTLHSTLSCPGATGSPSGMASLAQLEAGQVRECPVCHMDVVDMGKVGAASTSIDNGFEHYWKLVVEASRKYQEARNDQAEAEKKAKGAAEEASNAFDKAIEALSVPRPRLCPPGAWGCVAVVVRGSGTEVPSELTQAFLSNASLPAGAAVSAATLAPDDSTANNDLLSRFFDNVSQGEEGSTIGGVVDGICGIWGSLLVAYGSAYQGIGDIAEGAFDSVQGGGGGALAGWVRQRLTRAVRDAGFEPCDLRLRKPVLANTQDVMDKAGYGDLGTIREFVDSLPSEGSPQAMAEALGQSVADEIGSTTFTIAELPIPGTGMTVPLTIDLAELARAS